MFFDDDDGDFSPAMGGGSKLSSLFGMSSSSGGNESLTYTAPKQPKSKDNTNGTEKSDAKASAPSVLNAVAVHAFRYVNGQYAKQGKLGMAVLGDHKNKDYKILLYVSQKQPVAAAKIHNGFNFTVQQNNYATFYDDQSQLWSICFENNSQATEFGKWVCLAKFNCSPVGLLTQDLSIGEGQVLQKGDTAELQYTGYLYTDKTFGKVFESNRSGEKLYKLKLGRGKVIKGWEEGIPGMKKGGKRLLIIPPGLAYGAKGVGDRIPPNATLIFEVDVTRAKFANPDATASEESSRTASPDVAQNPTPSADVKKATLPKVDVGEDSDMNSAKASRSESVKSNREEERKDALVAPLGDSVKGRTHSISEQLSKSLEQPSGKANLLARMSKMGQSLLPSSPAKSDGQHVQENAPESNQVVEKDDDSPTMENVKHEPESPSKPALKPRPDSQQFTHASSPANRPTEMQHRPEHHMHHSGSPSPPYSSHQQIMQPVAIYQPPPNQMFGMNPLQSMAYGAPMPTLQAASASNAYQSAEISLVITEGKLHHGEMKSLVERVAEKIDGLLSKVDRLERNDRRQETNVPMIAGGIEMEASVLSSNINRILQENEKLKKENLEKTTKIENLNEKISDMLFKNQSFLEKSNLLMEERADTIKVNATHAQARINSLEQENVALTSELASLKTRLTSFESELEAANSRESTLKAKLQKSKEEMDLTRERLDSASTHVSDHREEIEHMKSKYKDEKQENKKLKVKIEHLEEEVQEIKHEKESSEKALAERKKKQQLDRKKFDEEIEEIKSSHEEEIRSLKQRYKKGSLENEKLSALEAELKAKHQESLRKALHDAEQQWKEKLEEITSERNELQNANAMLHEKIEKLQIFKEKNETLTNSISELQEESRKIIEKLTDEIENQKSTVKDLKETIQSKEKEAFQKGLQQGQSETTNIKPSDSEVKSPNVGDEVKKVMNGVFFKLKNEFEADETYTGQEIMKEILETIREITMKMTAKDDMGSSDDDESDEGKESEENGDESEEESDVEEESDEDEVKEDDADEDDEDDAEKPEAYAKNKQAAESGVEIETEAVPVEREGNKEKEEGEGENEEEEQESDEEEEEEEEEEDGDKEEDKEREEEENEEEDQVNEEEDKEKEKEYKEEVKEENEEDQESEVNDKAIEQHDVNEMTGEHETLQENIDLTEEENRRDSSFDMNSEENKITSESQNVNENLHESIVDNSSMDRITNAAIENDNVDQEDSSEGMENIDQNDALGSEVIDVKEASEENEENTNEDSGSTLNLKSHMDDKVTNEILTEEESLGEQDESSNKSTEKIEVTENTNADNTDFAAVNQEKKNGDLDLNEPRESSKKLNEDKKSAANSLFGESDDDDDDGMFSQTKSSKKPAAAAFSRSPPPLFDDDDEDTNWIQ